MITSVPAGYAIDWIKASMKVAERNYSLCLACGLLVALVNMIIGFIPFIGAVASTVLLFLFYVAELQFVRRLMNKEEVNFEQFLQMVFDPKVFTKHSHYVVICAISALIATALIHIDSSSTSYYSQTGGIFMSLGGIWNLFNYVLVMLCAFAVDLQEKNPDLNWQTALRRAFAGLWQNIIPWILTSILIVIFLVVTMALCVLPFFLYFVPMMFPFMFLVYASIFEGLNIEQVSEDWRKPVSPVNN